MFSKADLKQFQDKSISVEEINEQVENFQKGFPFVKLTAAATPDNGIIVLPVDKVKELENIFDNSSSVYTIIKMVPASGAASRMFKSLFSYLESDSENVDKEVSQFLDNITDFAFYPALKKVLTRDEFNIDILRAEGDYKTVIRYLLNPIGLDYAALPKGLLDFHTYPNGVRTPLEEHLAEGIEYSKDNKSNVHLHFTVSPEHLIKFKTLAADRIHALENTDQCKFRITYSEQKSSTDTMAVDMNNEPFRNSDGSILFRPGGHGALIENLNELDANIAFIKNIDNVVPDKLKAPTYAYKKAIGGLLIKLVEQTNKYLSALDAGVDETLLAEIISYAKQELSIQFQDGIEALLVEEKIKVVYSMLNRPLRICGMVKNEGEPGGGPFWVLDENNNASLQVVESSQIDPKDEKQQQIIQQATHFNPVDLVCSLKDYQGKKFDLKEFTDPQTGFISTKSKDGKDLKAQELPGLWNGAMANWITLFVEVPIETFNPVKTVNDLLRPQHQ
jgi:hypothetical protein